MEALNITPIINAGIMLIAAAISAFAIPWIKKKANACDLEQLQAWTKIAVGAAEQLYTTLEGDKKKQYVLNYLAGKGYDIQGDDIENTVEAAVLELHSQLYGAAKEGADNE